MTPIWFSILFAIVFLWLLALYTMRRRSTTTQRPSTFPFPLEITMSIPMSTTVDRMVADLEAHPPTTLTEARERLTDLLVALRGSIEEKLSAIKTPVKLLAPSALPDYAAIMSEASVRVEAVGVVGEAVADLTKAETAAAAALDRVFTRLRAARVQARVWAKLSPPAVAGATGAGCTGAGCPTGSNGPTGPAGPQA